ncbi:MAG: hypothetical protein KKF33_18060 [Alphaproteobacteria bacterium]|nr:hypothetical protein [Alphaproteobacteria bacterium]
MLTSILVSIAQNVVLGWLWRRLQELVAAVAGLAPLFLMLPPEYQKLIIAVMQGQGGGYTVSVYIGFVVYLWTQWQSWSATVKPQVVTSDGKKIPVAKDTRAASQIEAVATAAPKPRTLWDRLTGK